MLKFKKLIDTNFSVVEATKVYKDMAIALIAPIIQTGLLATVFIMFGQALLSLLPQIPIVNVCFWVWVGFVFSVSTASFFKTSEDIILSKSAQIYDNITYTLLLSTKLFAVMCLILGTLALLLIPAFCLKNPLFSLPYKALVTIFIVAVLPFVYFAPLAVILREANILSSFKFSYYMVLQRWGRISESILVQIIFTVIIAFWSYFIVSLLFFPNSSDFFDFILVKATALSDLTRNLYMRFVLWEILQVFVFTMVSAIFIGINTILFMYFEGSIAKLLKGNKVSINPNRKKILDDDLKFVDVLAKSKEVNINTEAEEEIAHHKTREEILNEIYPGYVEENAPKNYTEDTSSSKDDVVILEDEYPEK